SIINDNSCEPVIYYWNEETQLLEEVEGQYEEGDCVKVELKHFSKYIVLNKNEYNRTSFRFTIKEPTADEDLKKSFDVAMVLDESGSILSSDFSGMKAQCSNLVSGLNDTDRIAVYTFDESVRTISSFESPTEAVKTIGSLYQHAGLTAIYDAIKTATNGFVANSSGEKSKIIILLTDGRDNCSSTTLNSAIEQAKASDVIIYAVGVGSVNKTALTDLSESTGGSFYYLSNFSQLKAVFNTIIEEADLYKDSDGDGLSDYHEKKIAAGELLTGSGEALNLCSKINYLSPDSDGDGLLDGEEVVIKKLPFVENYYCYMYSNPCMADTDLDTYDDYVEEYIGTSPINVQNSLDTSNIMNGSLPSGFSFNNWWDWKELIEEQAWNYIHNAVQEHIETKYEEIKKEVWLTDSLRCDLLKEFSREIWEVKPTSYAKEPKKQLGLAQLDTYVAAYPGGKIGGANIIDSSFTFGDYKVDYYNMQNGLIIYKFKKQKKEPEPVTVPEPETEKEKGYQYIPQTSPSNDYVFWGKVLGIVIVGGTVAEDIISGGIGISDDAASFTLAYKLIFG
ncbi:MAG: VWA domain-containing protein, partial [Lachnospiraceae bacterium]|nr:VWA domain-containing protein [Lachnospiraceae bacterium]